MTHSSSDHGYAPTTYCGDCGRPWLGAVEPGQFGCCFAFTSESTITEERIAAASHQIIAIEHAHVYGPSWRDIVRAEVAAVSP